MFKKTQNSFFFKKLGIIICFLLNINFFVFLKASSAESDELNNLVTRLTKVPSDIQKKILFYLIADLKNYLRDVFIERSPLHKEEIKLSAGLDVVSFLPNKRLLVGLDDKSLEIWDFVKKKKLFKKKFLHRISAIAVDKKHKRIAVSFYHNVIKVLALDNLEEIWSLNSLDSQYVSKVVFSRDGKMLASCSFDKKIRIWDLEAKKCKVVCLKEGECFPCDIVFSFDCKKLFVGCLKGKVICFDVCSCERVKEINNSCYNASCVFFSKDGIKQVIYSNESFGRLLRIGPLGSKEIDFMAESDFCFLNVFFNNDNSNFVSISDYGGINIWNNRKLLRNIDGGFFITSFDLNFKGSKIVFGGFNGSLYLVNLYGKDEKEALSYFDSIHKLTAPQMFLLYLLFENKTNLKGKGMNLALTQQRLEKKYGHCDLLDLRKSYRSLPLKLKTVVEGVFNLKDE